MHRSSASLTLRTSLTLRWAAVITGLVVLVGCGSTTADRQAADAEDQGISASASASPVKGPFFKDSRVCIINTSSKTATITFLKSDKHDSNGPLAPGAKSCVEGGFYSEPDVKGTIAIGSVANDFFAYNGTGSEYAAMWEVDDPDHWYYTRVCSSLGAVGRTYFNSPGATWDDGRVRYTWAKLPDSSNFKEWTMTLADSQEPVDTGLVRKCPEADPDVAVSSAAPTN